MDDPCRMLLESYRQAQTLGDSNSRFFSMTTLDESGCPVCRIVTLREITMEGILIYINRESPKIEQLKRNPVYELLFFWPSLLRQFRVRGRYEIRVDAGQGRNWQTKSYAGKLYDLFHVHGVKQSSILPSRDFYLQKAAEVKSRFPAESDLEMPAENSCILFIPNLIESWYGSMEDHLHDRRLFHRLKDGAWTEQVLVP